MEMAVRTGLLDAGAYTSKQESYFAGARMDFIERLPKWCPLGVLEIGCGDGSTGALALKSGVCERYVGVELFPEAAAKARQKISDVLVGDVQTMDLPFEPASFDAVILSEVLEHLVSPWQVLKQVAPMIRRGGVVLASSPNVAHWRVIRELLAGRFDLADSGVFDRTHMRWFTPGSFARMFEDAGFEVVSVAPVTPFAARTRLLSSLTGGRLDHLFMTQISLEGRRL
ncbi:MAG: class I SAM-dependent methyltransferase [Hyphomicrobiaceae bacterium]|nr:class I SAM-dependent methyltransferase [Hyphomicrobiaceae bacterium]